jgi:ectoine hydroxylase-related dioxygenase (phytanoyl-CoA dioxygenase family)
MNVVGLLVISQWPLSLWRLPSHWYFGQAPNKTSGIKSQRAHHDLSPVPSDDPILTLSTCYPFRFIGNAPKRYIVQAGLVIGEPIA